MFFNKSRPQAYGILNIIKRPAYTARSNPIFKQKKERRDHNGYAIGSVYLQKVCSPPDASSSVILRTPHKSYLFNCGEETSRKLSAQSISPGNVDHIFLSQIHWGTLGGISSIFCEIFRKNGSLPKIHSPSSLMRLIRRLAHLTALGVTESKAIQQNTMDTSTVFEDNDVCIESILIPSGNDKEKTSISYLCTLKALKGDVSPFEKRSSQETRFNDRREFKFLSKPFVGVEHTIDAQVNIHFFFNISVLDIPKESYMSNFASNEVMANMASIELDFIIHFTPMEVFKSTAYQKIITEMKPKQHFLLNDSSK